MRRIGTLALVVALAALLTAAPAAAVPMDRAGSTGEGAAVLQLLERLFAPIFGNAQVGVPGDGAASAEAPQGTDEDSGAQTDPDG